MTARSTWPSFDLEADVDLLLVRGDPVLGARQRRVEPLGDVAQALGRDLSLRLGRAGDVAQAALHAIGCLACELDDPVGDLRLGLADELLDRLLELAREPLGGLLARLLDLCVEPPLGVLGEAGDRPVERLLELGELPALGFGLPGDDARAGLGLLAVDLLPEPALPAPQALADLVQGAAPFGGVGLELVAAFLDELGDEPLELGAQLRERLPLLLARGCEPLGVGVQARVVLVQGLLLTLAQLGELGLELRAGRGRGRRPRS